MTSKLSSRCSRARLSPTRNTTIFERLGGVFWSVSGGCARQLTFLMFNPIKLKFKKEHKKTFKNKEYSIKKSSLSFGDFGITAKGKGVLFYKELEAAKKVVAKAIKGIGIVVLRVRPIRPRTKKKKGMRMGKGKGPVDN